MSIYQQRREAYNEAKKRAHAQEFFHDVSDSAQYMSMGVGISPKQATVVALRDGKEHGTIGGVHVAITEEGKLVVAVEAIPEMEIEVRRTIKRPKWRFRDFWRWDAEKHDNVLRAEWEWPVLEEIV